LAFRGTYERDEHGEATEEAYLGAALEAEFQAAVIAIAEGLSNSGKKKR
jgi:hypothetical protein